MKAIINQAALQRRTYWVEEIRKLSGNFGNDVARLENELHAEIKTNGSTMLINHLRLCGCLPESYGHDSSEEKLYSKYTDILLAESFRAIGLRSLVLQERADAADVEAFGKSYSLVADAKAFRLSRTAKNQKDFKVQAMHGWKRGKPYAIVVCPMYQLPAKASQIYQQASAHNVCVLTYSHLALLVSLAQVAKAKSAEDLLSAILKTVPALNVSKDATPYWLAINRTMLDFSKKIEPLWRSEKQAAIESIAAAKEEALTYLANERARLMSLSHEAALNELVKAHKLESRQRVIESIADNGLLGIC